MARNIYTKHSFCKLVILSVITLSVGVVAHAQAAPIQDGKRELPKSGVLSENVISGGSVSESVPEPWGGTDVTGKEAPPISGSVSRVGKDRWVMRVFNNSTDTYSVSLSVDQLTSGGRKVKSDSFSYTLKPGQTAERDINSASNTESCSLQLRSWKNLSQNKTGSSAALKSSVN